MGDVVRLDDYRKPRETLTITPWSLFVYVLLFCIGYLLTRPL